MAAAAAEGDGPRRVSGSEIRAFVDQQRAAEASSHWVGPGSSGDREEVGDGGETQAPGTEAADRPAQNAEPEETERWGDFLPVPMAEQYGLKSKRKRSGQGGGGGRRSTGGSRFGEMPTLGACKASSQRLQVFVLGREAAVAVKCCTEDSRQFCIQMNDRCSTP